MTNRQQLGDDSARLLRCFEVFDESANIYLRDICQSFIKQNRQHGCLTAPQRDRLITWEGAAGSRELYDAWRQQFLQDENIKQMFSSCVEFFNYHPPGCIFPMVLYRHRRSPADGTVFVPAKNIYDKMTTEKRFLAWRHNAISTPKFFKGDLVEGRKTSNHHRDYIYIITEVKDEYDHCKDGRWYSGYIASRPNEKPRFTSYWWESETLSRTFREKDVKVFRRNSH